MRGRGREGLQPRGFEQNRYYMDWVKGEEVIEEVSKMDGFGKIFG